MILLRFCPSGGVLDPLDPFWGFVAQEHVDVRHIRDQIRKGNLESARDVHKRVQQNLLAPFFDVDNGCSGQRCLLGERFLR